MIFIIFFKASIFILSGKVIFNGLASQSRLTYGFIFLHKAQRCVEGGDANCLEFCSAEEKVPLSNSSSQMGLFVHSFINSFIYCNSYNVVHVYHQWKILSFIIHSILVVNKWKVMVHVKAYLCVYMHIHMEKNIAF